MAGTSPAMTRKGQSIRRLVSFPWLRGSWSGFRSGGIGVLSPLVPAKAGTQGSRRRTRSERPLDSRLRGNERTRVVDQLDRNTLQYLLEQAPPAQLRLDVVQFEPRPFQPRPPSVGIVRAVVVDAALRRRYPVACALEVG